MQELGCVRARPLRRLPCAGRIPRGSHPRRGARRSGDRSHRHRRRRPPPAADGGLVRSLGVERGHRPRHARRRLRRRHRLGGTALVAPPPLRSRRRRGASRSTPGTARCARETERSSRAEFTPRPRTRRRRPRGRAARAARRPGAHARRRPRRRSAGAARPSRSTRSPAASRARATATSRTTRRSRRAAGRGRARRLLRLGRHRLRRPARAPPRRTHGRAPLPGLVQRVVRARPRRDAIEDYAVAASSCARCDEIPCRCARTSSCSPSSSSTSGSSWTSRSRIRTGSPSVNAYGLSSFASLPVNGSASPALLVVPELAERGDVRGADLDPARVAEVALLLRRSAARAAPARSSGRRSAPCSTAKSSSTQARLRRSSSSSRKIGLRQAHADVARLARVGLATDVAGEGHYAAVAVPGRYCCQTCGIVGRREVDEEHGRRRPRRPLQVQPGVLEQAVALAQVARRAGGDDVLPDRLAPLRARHDVVERQPAAGGAAVDAAPAVAREERAPRDLALDRARHADVLDEPDHVRPDEGVGRGAQALRQALEDLRLPLPHEHVRAPHRTDVERLVTCVQDENLLQLATKRTSVRAAVSALSAPLPARPPRAPRGRARPARLPRSSSFT